MGSNGHMTVNMCVQFGGIPRGSLEMVCVRKELNIGLAAIQSGVFSDRSGVFSLPSFLTKRFANNDDLDGQKNGCLILHNCRTYVLQMLMTPRQAKTHPQHQILLQHEPTADTTFHAQTQKLGPISWNFITHRVICIICHHAARKRAYPAACNRISVTKCAYCTHTSRSMRKRKNWAQHPGIS